MTKNIIKRLKNLKKLEDEDKEVWDYIKKYCWFAKLKLNSVDKLLSKFGHHWYF